MATTPIEPARLTATQLAALDADAKARFDRQRFTWLASDVVLETPDITSLAKKTRIAFARAAASTATARRGIAISGVAGIGKSTAALYVGRRHENSERRRLDRGGDMSFAPVVYGVVPPGTTPKMLMLAFANWLGLPIPNRVTAQQATEMIVGVLRDLRTSLVIVDEVHNLRTNHAAGSEAASTLKGFADRLDATFLYAGIDLRRTDLFNGDMGRQLKARMIVHDMHHYPYATAEQRDDWAALVAGIEALLPLAGHPERSLVEEGQYLWDRTGGAIGSLRALLSDAAIEAIITGTEIIDRRLLEGIATDEAATENARTNATKPPGKAKWAPLARAT